MSQTHITHQQTKQEGLLDYCASPYQVDPVTLRRIFLLLTRNHYAQPSYFGDVPESFKKFKYTDDVKTTSVRVELDYNFDWESAQVPNAIFIGVGDVTTTKQVMDSFEQPNTDRSGRDNVDTDRVSVVISHLSKSADSALKMGVISKGFYQGMRQILKNKLGLRGYSVAALTKPKPVKKGDELEYYQVDLVINLVINSAWQTSIESHRLKKINVELD